MVAQEVIARNLPAPESNDAGFRVKDPNSARGICDDKLSKQRSNRHTETVRGPFGLLLLFCHYLYFPPKMRDVV
jgi:hypothetical protein